MEGGDASDGAGTGTEIVYGRTHRGGLSQADTFRRWRDRYEAEGADGLYDRRLGRLSARRAPVDEVARVPAGINGHTSTRSWFTARAAVGELQAGAGARRPGVDRRKRPRRALPGTRTNDPGP